MGEKKRQRLDRKMGKTTEHFVKGGGIKTFPKLIGINAGEKRV